MNVTRSILIILICAASTYLERAFPFLLFRGKEVPKPVQYLGKVLPMAVIATLIIYCLKNVSFKVPENWVAQLGAAAVTVGLHLWRRNAMLSIFGGTLVCMLLMRLV